MDAHLQQGGNGGGRVLLDGVGHRDDSSRAIADGHQHGALAGGFKFGQLRFERRNVDSGFAEIAAVADAHVPAADAALDAACDMRREALDLRHLDAPVARAGDHRLSQRMFGARLHRGRGGKHLIFDETVGRHDIGQRGLAAGDGAGLVEHNRPDVLQGLDRLAGTDQHAALGAEPRTHHDRRRRRQAQRTGAGDDEDRDGGENADHQRRQFGIDPGQEGSTPEEDRPQALAEEEPQREAAEADQDDRRDEARRQPVGEFLDRHFRALRLFDQTDDLRQEGVGADLRGADLQHAFLVDGGADDGIARPLLDRHGFARRDRLVEMACAFDNLAIGRDLGARPHDHDVALDEFGDRHVDLGAVAQHRGGLGTHGDQPLDRLAGAALGACFQITAQHVESHDGGGHLDEGGHRIEEADKADQIGRQAAHRDQHVHVGGAVGQRKPGRAMGGEAAIEKHHREGENGHDRQVERDRLPEHVRRHDQHDYRCRDGGDPEPFRSLGKVAVLDSAFVGCRGGFRLVKRRNFVAGTFDGGAKA